MGLDKKSRKVFLASIGHNERHGKGPDGSRTVDEFL